jgi:hypothetical protein
MGQVSLEAFIYDFARGLERADAKRPQSKGWQPGIGPHDEEAVINLVMNELVEADPERYATHAREVSYGAGSQRCDLCLGSPPHSWALEFKALRMLGDRGIVVQGRDDVSRILSPYPQQRSALTDCVKLAGSGLADRRGIVVYAYDFEQYPMESVIDAFELLAVRRVTLGQRYRADFEGLIHPVHRRGAVFGWELLAAYGAT